MLNNTKINLPWDKPPLTLNSRNHWSVKHRKTKMIRQVTTMILKQPRYNLKPLQPGHKLRVELHYRPRDNRRRDTDNLLATAKPIYDAFTKPQPRQPGAGIVDDDTPDYMIKPEPVIHRAERGRDPEMWLILTEVAPIRDIGAE